MIQYDMASLGPENDFCAKWIGDSVMWRAEVPSIVMVQNGVTCALMIDIMIQCDMARPGLEGDHWAKWSENVY